MGRWTYYSPLWLGPLLVLAMNESLRAQLPTLAPAAQWSVVAAAAVIFGFHCQVLMIGAQGAFAQVLPVPRGKSIRGGAAMLGGWLLIAWFGLAMVTVLLGFEKVTAAAFVVGVVTLAALGGAIVVYVWNVPAAAADFGADRRR